MTMTRGISVRNSRDRHIPISLPILRQLLKEVINVKKDISKCLAQVVTHMDQLIREERKLFPVTE